MTPGEAFDTHIYDLELRPRGFRELAGVGMVAGRFCQAGDELYERLDELRPASRRTVFLDARGKRMCRPGEFG